MTTPKTVITDVNDAEKVISDALKEIESAENQTLTELNVLLSYVQRAISKLAVLKNKDARLSNQLQTTCDTIDWARITIANRLSSPDSQTSNIENVRAIEYVEFLTNPSVSISVSNLTHDVVLLLSAALKGANIAIALHNNKEE